MRAILLLLLLAVAGCKTCPVVPQRQYTDAERFAELVRVYGQVDAAAIWEERR